MHQIVVTPSLARELGQAVGHRVSGDSDGRVIGFFSPLKDHPRRGKPLDEILGRLGD